MFMIHKNLLNQKILLIILLLFPISVLLRSFFINLYFVLLSFFYIYLNIFNFNNKIKLDYLWIKIFFLILIYLFLISFSSEDSFSSLKNGLSQIRFILFVLLMSHFSIKYEVIKDFLLYSSVIVILVCLDTLFQYYNGEDFFGFSPGDPSKNPNRLSGPFDQELIVGSFIFMISIPIISNYIYNYNKTNNFEKVYLVFFTFICFITVLLSGERMSFIFFLFSLMLILFFNKGLIKTIILSIFIFITLTSLFFFNSSVKNRFTNFYNDLNNFSSSSHFRLFSSSVNLWNEEKLIGLGLKNYRIKCNEDTIDKNTNQNTLCSSHPHNFYLEFLSETGILGLILFLSFFSSFFYYVYKEYKNLNNKFKGFFLGSLIILICYLWPIKSSGSFFSTYTASYFWFNLAMVYLLINSTKKKRSSDK